MIPHAIYPYGESPWVPHFHDVDALNMRLGHSGMGEGNELARHIMTAGPSMYGAHQMFRPPSPWAGEDDDDDDKEEEGGGE